MRRLQRSIFVLLALLMSTVFIAAQESTPEATEPAVESSLRVSGSGVVNPLLQELNGASDSPLELTVETTGTSSGFQQFCTGEVDIATATRALTVDEDALCADNNIDYAELLLGHNIVTFISNGDDEFLSCLTSDDIGTLFAPSAAGNITQWSQLTPEAERAQTSEGEEAGYPELDIMPVIPQQNTLTYVTLDEIVEGIGLRNDATSASINDILETVGSTSGAIGVVPLQAAQETTENIFILDVNFADVESGCESPSPETVEDRLYTGATPLLIYVNRTAVDAAEPLLSFLTDDTNIDIIAESGFSPASAQAYETNRAVVAGEESGRAFSEGTTEFEVPQFLSGTINIGGAAAPYGLANAVGNNIATTNRENLTINVTTEGTINDIPEFCEGNLDIVYAYGGGLTDDQQATCDENSITTVTLPLGGQGAILLGNAADDYAACLTTEQVATIWGATSTGEVNNWTDVSETFPDQEMMLFGFNAGNVLSDILLAPASEGAVQPIRIDTELNTDPLYRAAAVANVEGSLTYMNWRDYQAVLANEQERIQLVAINAGNGCIVPDVDAISDGSYPLSVELSLVINQESLTNPAVQSYLWTLYSDENYDTLFERNDIVGVTFGDLADIRDQLLVAFDTAEAAQQAALEAEATAEATIEATAEVTPAVDAEDTGN